MYIVVSAGLRVSLGPQYLLKTPVALLQTVPRRYPRGGTEFYHPCSHMLRGIGSVSFGEIVFEGSLDFCEYSFSRDPFLSYCLKLSYCLSH